MSNIPPWAQRLLTILVGVGVGTLGVLVPQTAPFALPAAGALLGWSAPHPADAHREAPKP